MVLIHGYCLVHLTNMCVFVHLTKGFMCEDFHGYHPREVYMIAYNEIIHSMPNLNGNFVGFQIPKCREVNLSKLHKDRDGQKKIIKRGIDEPLEGSGNARRSSIMRCNNCKEFGHHKRTCKGVLIKKKKKNSNFYVIICKW